MVKWLDPVLANLHGRGQLWFAPFAVTFILTFCFWILFSGKLVSVYSIGYMRTLKEHAQTRFYFSFALAPAGAIGVAFAANLVTLFIFYEVLTLSTYPLTDGLYQRSLIGPKRCF